MTLQLSIIKHTCYISPNGLKQALLWVKLKVKIYFLGNNAKLNCLILADWTSIECFFYFCVELCIDKAHLKMYKYFQA